MVYNFLFHNQNIFVLSFFYFCYPNSKNFQIKESAIASAISLEKLLLDE